MNRKIALFGALGVLALGFAPHKSQPTTERLMDEAVRILELPPDDGLFGVTRFPPLQGKQAKQKKEALEIDKAWDELSPDYYLTLTTYGYYNGGQLHRYGKQDFLYQVNQAPLNTGKFVEAEENYRDVARREALRLFESKQPKAKTIEIDYAGRKALLDMRTIFPSHKSCVGCHREVKDGNPIGVVTLLRVPKK